MKRKFLTILLLLLILSLAIFLVACDENNNGEEKESGTNDGDSSNGGTIIQNNGKFTVTFDKQIPDQELIKVEVNNGETVMPPDDPVREGYLFDGWYEKDATYRFNFNMTTITKDITLYAKWNEACTVTFDFNYEGNKIVKNIGKGNIVPRQYLEREGYRIVGWYKEPSFITEWNFSNNTLKEDMVLYAKWEKFFTVTFKSYDKVLDTQTVGEGKAAVAPANPHKDPTNKLDYVFQKWDKDFTNITSNLVVNAIFKEVDVSKLCFSLQSNKKEYSVSAMPNIAGEVIIPNTYNGKPVTEISSFGFRDKTEMTSITIPASIKVMYTSEFRDCKALETVIFEENTNLKVLPQGVFDGCTSLKKIVIPEGVTNIEQNAFNDCTSLTSIKIPSTVDTFDVYSFQGCSAINSIEVSSQNSTYKTESNCLLTKDGKTLVKGWKNSTIPSGVQKIDSSAFSYCSGLTSITIPEGVKIIGNYAFDGCSNLQNIEFPTTLQEIGSNAFHSTKWYNEKPSNELVYAGDFIYEYKDNQEKCYNITILPSVIGIANNAFNGCINLESVTIPENVKYIGQSAFYNCTKLTTVIIESKEVAANIDNNKSCLFNKAQIVYIKDGINNIDSYFEQKFMKQKDTDKTGYSQYNKIN